jgi:nicotinate phosphoribosyltransferase
VKNRGAIYRSSLALLADLYELTMAYGYWNSGADGKESVFHMHFRENPFGGGFTVACGLEQVIDHLRGFHFDGSDLEYLSTLKNYKGKRLFNREFLRYLEKISFSCDIDAVPEGTMVFPHEPLVRVQGPLIQCQLIESAILNAVNFQSLIATKAARVCIAAQGDPVLEFGLRRAQGIDGALSASRAAYIGGCAATSNTLAGKHYGIPVRGTIAHSWVMSFENELTAFKTFAGAMPDNSVLLVDTYDSLEGVRNAIETGAWLRKKGGELYGIRIDSGDLAYLSGRARAMLDKAGFRKTRIFASNELDEHIIDSLKEQGAKITMWGVGTKLATGYDQPALGGVYKLSAIRNSGGTWNYTIKLSEQAVKVSTPGIIQVRRYHARSGNIADALYETGNGISNGCTIVDPFDSTRQMTVPPGTAFSDLLVPIFRKGKSVYSRPVIGEIRERTQRSLNSFHEGIKRFVNPHRYPVGLEKSLYNMRIDLIARARAQRNVKGGVG